MRQIIFQRQPLVGQTDGAVFAHIQPEGCTRWVLTNGAIVTNKLQTHAVKIADVARINRYLCAVFLTQLLFRNRQHAHEFIVKKNFYLRLYGE